MNLDQMVELRILLNKPPDGEVYPTRENIEAIRVLQKIIPPAVAWEAEMIANYYVPKDRD